MNAKLLKKHEKITFVVSPFLGDKKWVVMLLVVEKMRFLKIILSITFFNMENLNKIVKNVFFREKIIAFFHGKNVFFWKKYFCVVEIKIYF